VAAVAVASLLALLATAPLRLPLALSLLLKLLAARLGRQRNRLALEVEGLRVAVVAEAVGHSVGPLRLVRMNVDARLTLLVHPAAARLLALQKESLVAAGPRYAELHLAALVSPALRLLGDGVRDDTLDHLVVKSGAGGGASSLLLRRLLGNLGILPGENDVAPERAVLCRQVEVERLAVEHRVLGAVAGALLRAVRVTGLRNNPVATGALPDKPVAALVHSVCWVRVAVAARGAVVEVEVSRALPEEVVRGQRHLVFAFARFQVFNRREVYCCLGTN